MNPTWFDTLVSLFLPALLLGVVLELAATERERRRAMRVRYLSVVGFLADPELPPGEYVRNRYRLMVYTEKRAGIMPWRVAS